eukprot:1140848-Pelagomonas_calceolata.AAC.1
MVQLLLTAPLPVAVSRSCSRVTVLNPFAWVRGAWAGAAAPAIGVTVQLHSLRSILLRPFDLPLLLGMHCDVKCSTHNTTLACPHTWRQVCKPKEFAGQINLNMDHCWGIIRALVDMLLKLDDGKYLCVKDPMKELMRMCGGVGSLLLHDGPHGGAHAVSRDMGSSALFSVCTSLCLCTDLMVELML